MSKNFIPSSYDPPRSREKDFALPSQQPSQALPSSLTNSNPRPPVFFLTAGPKHVLNYSFQTGEEFALEFMKERANPRSPAIPTISEDQNINTSYVDQREAIVSVVGQPTASNFPASATEENYQNKMMSYAPCDDISSQGSISRFPSLSSDLAPTKLKFLCNFGGKFLPRPSDGKVRYVGGEKHILQISKDMSWQELIKKTTKLYRRAHIMKYHLPGENVNVLISVASDEDLHNMIDECSILEDREEKPTMFLFPLDDDDEHHLHYDFGSIDMDAEVQFIAAVNGAIGSVETSSAQGFGSASASINDLDQLMFHIDEEAVVTGKSEEGSASAKDKHSLTSLKVLPRVPSKGTIEKMPSNFRTRMSNQDNSAQIDEGDVSSFSAKKTINSGQKDTGAQFDSFVPSEFKYPPKRDRAGKSVLRQQTDLQRANTIAMERLHGVSRTQDKVASTKELLISLDDAVPKVSSPNKGDKTTTPRYTSPRTSLTSHIDKISKDIFEPLIQLSQSDDSAVQYYHQTPERASTDKLSSLGKVTASTAITDSMEESEQAIRYEDSDNSISSTNQGELTSLSQDSMRSVYQHMSSEETMMKSRRQEDGTPPPVTDFISRNKDGESYKRSFELHKKTELTDPNHSIKPNEANILTPWQDDMYISMNSHNRELLFSVSSRESRDSSLKDVKGLKATNANKKDGSSLTPGVGERVHPPRPFSSSDNKATERQKSPLSVSSDKSREGSPSRVESSQGGNRASKIIRSQSVGNDNILHIGYPSQEARDNVAVSISELEEYEPESHEVARPEMEAFMRDHVISNVQIINNEDLEDLRELGSGAFGTVFHGRWKGTDVAIKRIKNSCFTYPSSQSDKLITEFWREASILSKLHHPNVLAFYGVVNNGPGGTLATVTEFMVSGSLKKVLLRKDKFLDRRKRIMLAMDAAIGMEYLHSKNIIHFDLKCDNLLVNLKDPSRPICKVADFGLSKMKQTTMVSGGMRGTLPWMAPELLTMSSSKVSEKVDVYSFGIVMWEVLTSEEPYAGMHYGGVIGGILNNILRPPVPNSCEPAWRKLMEQCWSTDPEQRPFFTEVAIRLRSMLETNQGQAVS